MDAQKVLQLCARMRDLCLEYDATTAESALALSFSVYQHRFGRSEAETREILDTAKRLCFGEDKAS